jgi:hypothetical protein
MKQTMILIALTIFVLLVIWLIPSEKNKTETISDTKNTTEEKINNFGHLKDLIVLNTPEEDEIVSSPILIKGEARGSWFFEGSFPVVLVDWDGKIIAQGNVTAKGEWMTENFVPFSASLDFVTPDLNVQDYGFLILKKDNPSGDPIRDASVQIRVRFK